MSYDYTLITNTDDVALDPISSMVQTFLAERAILSKVVMQGTHEAGADSASYPRAAGFTAEAVPTDSNSLSAQAIDWAVDKLDFDKDYAVLVNIKERAASHSVVDQFAQIQIRQAQALVDAIEASVYTALAAASGSAPDHKIAFGTSATLALNDILSAIVLLDTQKVPWDNRYIAVHPAQYKNLLALGDFTDASKYGSNEPLLNGEIGRIYGMPVLKSTNVTTATVLVFHSEHVVFAMDKQINMKQQDDLDKVSTKLLMHARWGVKTLDSGKRGVLINNAGS